MIPQVRYEIDPPYPWRPLRIDEYAPRVEDGTVYLPQLSAHAGEPGAPSLITSVHEHGDDMIEIRILVGGGVRSRFTQHWYVRDGENWVRRRRQHRDVRMRLQQESQMTNQTT